MLGKLETCRRVSMRVVGSRVSKPKTWMDKHSRIEVLGEFMLFWSNASYGIVYARHNTHISCTTDGITGQRVIASLKWSRLCLGGSPGIRDDSDGGSSSADVKQSGSTN